MYFFISTINKGLVREDYPNNNKKNTLSDKKILSKIIKSI